MASTEPRTIFLAFIVILVVVIIILLGICWKVFKPDVMRKLMRPRSPGSGETSHDLSLWMNLYSFHPMFLTQLCIFLFGWRNRGARVLQRQYEWKPPDDYILRLCYTEEGHEGFQPEKPAWQRRFWACLFGTFLRQKRGKKIMLHLYYPIGDLWFYMVLVCNVILIRGNLMTVGKLLWSNSASASLGRANQSSSLKWTWSQASSTRISFA